MALEPGSVDAVVSGLALNFILTPAARCLKWFG
jgi:hypothetical protein